MDNLNNSNIKNKKTSDLLLGFLIVIIIMIFVFAVNVVNCKNESYKNIKKRDIKERFSELTLIYKDYELKKLLSSKKDINTIKRVIDILNSNDYNLENLEINGKKQIAINLINMIIDNFIKKSVSDNNLELYYLLKSLINQKLEKFNFNYSDLYEESRADDNITNDLKDIPNLNFNKNDMEFQLNILKSKLIMNKNNMNSQNKQDENINIMMNNMNDVTKLINIYKNM